MPELENEPDVVVGEETDPNEKEDEEPIVAMSAV